jgi:hypothetical protein
MFLTVPTHGSVNVALFAVKVHELRPEQRLPTTLNELVSLQAPLVNGPGHVPVGVP